MAHEPKDIARAMAKTQGHPNPEQFAAEFEKHLGKGNAKAGKAAVAAPAKPKAAKGARKH